jgi:hypothetical protein
MTDDAQRGRYLAPRALQVFGIVLLVGSAVFWAITDRESTLLFGSAMALIGAGSYGDVVAAHRKP